jgi:hypothetical protein
VPQPFAPFQQRVRVFPTMRNKLKRHHGTGHLHFLRLIVIEKEKRFGKRQRREARKSRVLPADEKDAPPETQSPQEGPPNRLRQSGRVAAL